MSAHAPTDALSAMEAADHFRTRAGELRAAIERCVVGLGASLEECLWCLLADGHLLLEGVPGLGKTLLVRTIAQAAGLHAGRVQCTPDLMPSDIVGTAVLLDDPVTGQRVRRFRPGPIFCQVLLVDEINRAAPRSQSALLEAMQERQVTIGENTYKLPDPFLVLATQNPIESEGTYHLPEAQLDRFLFKIVVNYPQAAEEDAILRLHCRPDPLETLLATTIRSLLDPARVIAVQDLCRQVRVDDAIIRYSSAIVRKTRQWPAFSLGASPRAGIALVTGARVVAAFAGRSYVVPDDVTELVQAALRHRVILSPEAEVAGDSVDGALEALMRTIEVPRL
jgi:MoxR-like ATPase